MKKNSKIFVAGSGGLVGSAIVRRLQAGGYTNLLTPEIDELDLTDQKAVSVFFAAGCWHTWPRRRAGLRNGEFDLHRPEHLPLQPALTRLGVAFGLIAASASLRRTSSRTGMARSIL